jgi:hypothetical protein
MTFDRESGVYEALRKDLRKFVPLPPPLSGGDGERFETAKGAPTIVVAASDASELSKQKADMVCVGVNDEVIIQAALDSITYGRCLLTEGTFTMNEAGVITLDNGQTLEGLSPARTLLTLAAAGVTNDNIIEGGSGTRVANLRILSTIATIDGITFDTSGEVLGVIENVGVFVEGVGIVALTDYTRITGVRIDSGADSAIDVSGDFCTISGSWLSSADIGVDTIAACANLSVVDSYITAGSHAVRLVDADNVRIIGNSVAAGGTGVHATTSDWLHVADNHFDGPSQGCYLEGNVSPVVNGNTFDKSVTHNIELNDQNGAEVYGNVIGEASALAANTYDNVHLRGSSDNNFIHGNILYSGAVTSTRYGINVSAATCDTNRIGDNDYGTIADYGTDILNDAGTGTIYTTAANVDFFDGRATLTTGTGSMGKKLRQDARIVQIIGEVGTAPTGADLIIDLQKNGGSNNLYTTQANRPTVAATTTTSTTTLPDVVNLLSTDYLTVDIDQIGSSVAGGYLVLTLLVIYI